MDTALITLWLKSLFLVLVLFLWDAGINICVFNRSSHPVFLCCRSTCSSMTPLTACGSMERWRPRAASWSSATCTSRSSTSTCSSHFSIHFAAQSNCLTCPVCAGVQEGPRQHQMERCWRRLRGGVHRCVHHHREGLCKFTNSSQVFFIFLILCLSFLIFVTFVVLFLPLGSPEGRSQEGGDLCSQCWCSHVCHGRQPREVRQLHEDCQVSVCWFWLCRTTA